MALLRVNSGTVLRKRADVSGQEYAQGSPQLAAAGSYGKIEAVSRDVNLSILWGKERRGLLALWPWFT